MTEIKVVAFDVGQNPTIKTIGSSLESMQDYVGGYIQILNLVGMNGTPFCLICDEEGIIKQKARNRVIYDHFIFGNFFLCGTKQGKDGMEFTDIDEELIKEFHAVPMNYYK